MPTINLISISRAAKRASERQTQALFFTWIVEGALFASAFGFLLWRDASLEAQVAEVNARAQTLAPIEQQVQLLTAQGAEIQPKLTTLLSARHDTERWERILTHISVNTPAHTWVTSLRSELPKDEKSPSKVTMTGFASDQNLVGEIMMRLNACSDLQNIELKYTQAKTIAAAIGVEYEILTAVTTAAPTRGSQEVTSNEKT